MKTAQNESLYMASGNTYFPTTTGDMQMHPKLPKGVYRIIRDIQRGYGFSKHIDSFSVPDKIYGKEVSRCDRIFKHYDKSPETTGVLLSGLAGSGKTLLAKLMANRLIEDYNGIVVLLDQPFETTEILQFLGTVDQPCMLFADEFEKTFTEDDATTLMLKLLDGAYTHKRLVVVTCNNVYQIPQYMLNRPSRMYYHYPYTNVDSAALLAYLDDRLTASTHKEDIVLLSGLFGDSFNFDMMKTIVAEANDFPEMPFQELIEPLNIQQAPTVEYVVHSVSKEDDTEDALGWKQEGYTTYDDIFPPLVGGSDWVEVIQDLPEMSDKKLKKLTSRRGYPPRGDRLNINFTAPDFVSYDAKTSHVTYRATNGFVIVFKPVDNITRNYTSYIKGAF